MRYEKLGWNGLYFDIPKETRFTKQKGDAKAGSLVLEGEDLLIEVKWDPLPKKPKPLSLALGEYIEKLEKDINKKKRRKEKKTSIKVLNRDESRIFSHDALYVVMKVENEERYFIWYCSESNRIIKLRFAFGKAGQVNVNTIKRVIKDFQCHRDKYNLWSLLNVQFKTPLKYELTNSRIAVGRTQFSFSERKLSTFAERTSGIYFEYFSIANIVFRDTYRDLDQWFDRNYKKDLSKTLAKRLTKFKTVGSQKICGHKALIKKTQVTSGFLSRETTLCTNASWYCPYSNRIYSLTIVSLVNRPFMLQREIGMEEHDKNMNEILASTKCH